jgi:tetratricopeptide (TPR) repeat protein
MKNRLQLFIIAFALMVLPATAIYAESAESLSKSAVAKSQAGDAEGAIADFTRAIALDGKCELAYRNRGFIKGSMGDYQGAIADETKAIEIDPRSALAYYARGFARDAMGDRDGAAGDLRQSAKLGDPDARQWLKEHGYAEK